MNIWMGMDNYIINADQFLCSPQCPCFIKDTSLFTSNQASNAAFNQWTTTLNDQDVVNFQGCSLAVKQNVYDIANSLSPDFFNPNGDFNAAQFWAYMATIENRFSCSGFCNINYINSFTSTATSISKYIFTDVNRGVPANAGCLDIILNWLPSYLLAFGSVGIVLAFFQLISIIMAGILSHYKGKDYKNNDVVVVNNRKVIVKRPAIAKERRDVYVERPVIV